MKRQKITSHLILFCIASYTSSTYTIRPFTARAGSALSVACAITAIHAETAELMLPCLFAWSSPVVGISWILYRMTPSARLNRADDKLASVHGWISDPNFCAKFDSPEDQKALYTAIEHYFASKDFPFAAAKHDLQATLSYTLDARELAEKAHRDLSIEEKELSERCAQIIEKANRYDQKTIELLKVINKHPDYIGQMNSHHTKVNAEKQTAALNNIETTAMISATASTIAAVNSFHHRR